MLSVKLMESKKCVGCGKEFFRNNFSKKIWGLDTEMPQSHFAMKKYCGSKCKSRSKSKRVDRSKYFKEWRANNPEKVSKYIEKQKKNRRIASLKYYYKKTK